MEKVCEIIKKARYDLLLGYLVGYQASTNDLDRISYQKAHGKSLIKFCPLNQPRKRFAFLSVVYVFKNVI